MTRSGFALAVAAAVSLGIMKPATTPTVRETPLSNSDIVIANSSDGSAEMSNGSGPANGHDHDVGAESTPGKTTTETARWLQQVCGASVVFVTVCSDENTLERIHQQVPGAPILSKLSFREHLAAAVAEASKPTTRPT